MVYDLASTKHVFSDWDLIEAGSGLARHDPDRRDQKPARPPMHPTRELPHGVRISVHYPRIEPDRLVEPDTPEEGALICYVSIFEDDGLYRMYMMNWGDVNEGWDDGSRGNLYDYMLAYAESSDGTNWTKPSVGAVSWNGSTDNNLVYTGHAAPAFKDPNAPPDQRYKLVCMDTYNGRPCLRGPFRRTACGSRRWRRRSFSTMEAIRTPSYASSDRARDTIGGSIRTRSRATVCSPHPPRFPTCPTNCRSTSSMEDIGRLELGRPGFDVMR